MAASASHAPLVMHVVHRFDTGGLENGIVNLINHMPADAYRHAVVALTDAEPGFVQRIRRADVAVHALHKPPGHGHVVYPQLLRLMRQLQPAIVHTRNLGTLECQAPAWWARVPVRLHGEHGRDVGDLDGSNRRYQLVRRLYRPFVHRYIALSADLSDYLQQRVGVPAARIAAIYNGVDTSRFVPVPGGLRRPLPGSPFNDPALFVVGTVGRMQAVKGQEVLAQAFVQALAQAPALAERLRLVMVGDGPQRALSQRILADAGCSALAWLPGERSDVPDVMQHLDCFALPSWAEGISNTILEAMASGLAVLATEVGGNAELVVRHQTGALVPAGDAAGLGAQIAALAAQPGMAKAWGAAGRLRVERCFSMSAMVAAYRQLYDGALARGRGA
jgi:sugar transferase (PEP-CTERM/EpsH1 system associated)